MFNYIFFSTGENSGGIGTVNNSNTSTWMCSRTFLKVNSNKRHQLLTLFILRQHYTCFRPFSTLGIVGHLVQKEKKFDRMSYEVALL